MSSVTQDVGHGGAVAMAGLIIGVLLIAAAAVLAFAAVAGNR